MATAAATTATTNEPISVHCLAVLFSAPLVPQETFESRSGWHLQPEGLCQDDLCVPFAHEPSQQIDIRSVASALGMPVVEDDGLLALGPRAGRRVLHDSARAPAIVLPDVHGQTFDLASLHGKKVLLLAWASW